MASDASTRTMTIYVRLLDEGTDVSRPTQAMSIGGGSFKLLATPDYDPEDERWEFLPGSLVRCETREMEGKTYLLAVGFSTALDCSNPGGNQ